MSSLILINTRCSGQLGPECFGIRSSKVSLVDVTLAPSSTLLWYRTTLVRCGQRWDVVEHNQRDSDAQGSKPFQNPELVDEVLTLGHMVRCTPRELGFSMKRPLMSLLDPMFHHRARCPRRRGSLPPWLQGPD